MTHPKYGKKFTCFHCATKFYNMGAPKPICPKCGSNQKRAPKGQTGKTARQVEVPAFETEEENQVETTDDFPIKEEVDESFDSDSDHLSVDTVSDQDY
ncbi:hypothetical protein MNBD_NITROSPINAE04-1582 [hydrothermal vent metagenome]|uniref:TIGR02300 family protein n=1 Tax=hydrothermal vent metagenome TaxID=652676 RepID=A0A3B1CIG4_9ZZZZ